MKKVLVATHASQFPPEHGGAKNLRHMVESLAQNGVECRVLVKMHPPIPERIRFAGQHLSGLPPHEKLAATYKWEHAGVLYLGVPGESRDLAEASRREIESFAPDTFFLSDDSLDDGKELFEVGARSGRLVFLAQTIHSLPFGPYAMQPNGAITKSILKARNIFAPSKFVKEYVEAQLGVKAQVYYPNVFGQSPFPFLGKRSNRFVTMINPCPWKGSSILIALAGQRPDIEFAAVPTWGATPQLIEELKTLPNMTLLEETSDIDSIFAQTRVLLAPSLCQEAFGLVSPEALLRGVPVIASDIAGLRESTLGVTHLIPVTPLPFDSPREGTDHTKFVWREPDNPITPWMEALDSILADEAVYQGYSTRGRQAAEKFVGSLANQSVMSLLNDL